MAACGAGKVDAPPRPDAVEAKMQAPAPDTKMQAPTSEKMQAPVPALGFAGWKPQAQLSSTAAIQDCPGPIAPFPPGTPSDLTDWMKQPDACTRQAILPVCSPGEQCYGPPLPGPVWADYEAANPGYACGLPYDDPTAQYVTGGNWAVGAPDGPPPFGACTPPSTTAGANLGLCEQMYDDEQGCCCPFSGQGGCSTQPRFNWIVGVCQGATCNGTYREAEALKPYKNLGSQLVINYVAAYNFDQAGSTWKIAADASFNTDGSRGAYDAIRAHGGLGPEKAWLTPVPGGSVQWGSGLSPVGAEGLGPLATTKSTPGLEGAPAGVMFVLSTQRSYDFAFYMLNQGNIDRGAGSPLCENLNNCWGYGNGGEIDFLESPFSADKGIVDGYRRMYLNNINQVGRSFVAQAQAEDANGHANGGWGPDWETSAMMLGTDPLATTDTPLVYVAVVDRIGVWVYRFPGADVSKYWPGLTATTADAALAAAPAQPPEDFQPCTDLGKSCAMFIPNCQANAWGGPKEKGKNLTADPTGARNQGCAINGEQGFCQNWFQLLADTGQWQVTESGSWARKAEDPVHVSLQGPKGYCTCPDGKPADATWCIAQPWNRRMAPFLCETAYDETCERPAPACAG
jgi:hypothetical protein